VEIAAFSEPFPSFWIYGNGHVFSLKCICHQTLQLEKYMTVRMGYAGWRSSARTNFGTICPEVASVPRPVIRRGEGPGQERHSGKTALKKHRQKSIHVKSANKLQF
jgi:hypothetical protein